jgi:hypothetical protein
MPSEPGTDYSEVYLKAAREDFELGDERIEVPQKRQFKLL